MPTVESGQDWRTRPEPCPDCGKPIIKPDNTKALERFGPLDFEPLGRGIVLRYLDNDDLPTQGEAHDIFQPHECE